MDGGTYPRAWMACVRGGDQGLCTVDEVWKYMGGWMYRLNCSWMIVAVSVTSACCSFLRACHMRACAVARPSLHQVWCALVPHQCGRGVGM